MQLCILGCCRQFLPDMRHRILFGLLFTVTSVALGQVSYTETDIMDDPTKTLQFQKFWDNEFSEDWILIDVKKTDVDHFQPGIIITWEKIESGIVKKRSYSYTSGLQFHSAHEQRFKGDSLNCQGHVKMKDKSVVSIGLVYPTKQSLHIDSLGSWDYSVDYYLYEIYDKGKIECRYKSKWVNRYEDLFLNKNTSKIKSVDSRDCLNLLMRK